MTSKLDGATCNKAAMVFAALLVFGGACDAAPSTPLVVAHRGGAALLPENTLPAFDNAIKLGADWLEFDIEMTADDRLVISHDGSVNPSFCQVDPSSVIRPGPIRAMKLADVLQFDCGSKHRAIYGGQHPVPGTRMPTLDALLLRYRQGREILFGETKMPGAGEGEVDPIAFASLIATAVQANGLEDRFVLQSADYRTIDAMHVIAPKIRTCLLYPWLAKTEYLELAQLHHAGCMLLRLQDADATEVKRLHDGGIVLVSDVVDQENAWQAYRARGWDALFTNDPAALIGFLGRAKAHR